MFRTYKKRLHPKFGVAAFLFLALAVLNPAQAETVSAGLGEAVDGDTVILNGRSLNLSGIIAPSPGFRCTLRNRESDCGSIARGALLDLMAGATIICESDGQAWRCSAGGFDLAENLVHTGWVVPVRDNDSRFSVQLDRAMSRKQGLWRAIPHLDIATIRRAGGR